MPGEVVKGLKWNGIGQLVSQITVIVGSILLARILRPEDFGMVAMVTVISSFATLFLDMGFCLALIQRSSVTDNDLSTVFWLNLWIGLIFTVLICGFSFLIVDYYNNPSLYPIIYSISPVFVLGALQQIPRVILTRKMHFKELNIVSVSATLSSYILAIIIALNGGGLWSIVAQILIANVVICLLSWLIIKWRPTRTFKLESIKAISNFSINTFFNGFLEYWSRNLGLFLVGRHLGQVDLGIFSKSTSFILLPVRNISQVITTTIFPKLSNIKNEPLNFRPFYLLSSRFQFFIVFPAMLGINSITNELIPVLFGDEWIQMIPLVKIFAIQGIFSANFNFNDITISSQGRADLLFRYGILEKSIIILSIFLGIKFGIIGLAYARLIGAFITSFSKYYLLQKVTGITPIHHFHNFKKILISGTIMLLGIYLIDIFMIDSSLLTKMIIKVILGISLYTFMAYLVKEEIFGLLVNKLITKVKAEN